MKNFHGFTEILKAEDITRAMLSEWTGISLGRLAYVISSGIAEFRREEKNRIMDVFGKKYTEKELFG